MNGNAVHADFTCGKRPPGLPRRQKEKAGTVTGRLPRNKGAKPAGYNCQCNFIGFPDTAAIAVQNQKSWLFEIPGSIQKILEFSAIAINNISGKVINIDFGARRLSGHLRSGNLMRNPRARQQEKEPFSHFA